MLAYIGRDKEEIALITSFLNKIDTSNTCSNSSNCSVESNVSIRENFKIALETFRKAETTPVIANRISSQYKIAPSTLLLYYNEFVHSDFLGFVPDGRGKHERCSFLERYENKR